MRPWCFTEPAFSSGALTEPSWILYYLPQMPISKFNSNFDHVTESRVYIMFTIINFDVFHFKEM